MPNILCIETATNVCSVALVQDNRELVFREISEGFKHAEKITVFISEVVAEAGLNFKDLDAVAVSSGPGSYTGLRIGMSTAKGLCLAMDIPLISIPTLEILTAQAISEIVQGDDNTLFCPMIDARRMEVYCALIDVHLNYIQPVSAEIISEDFYYADKNNKSIYYFGDGAEKCTSILTANFIYHAGVYASAKFMARLALDKFGKKEFENTSLVEPFYLKEFQAGRKNS